MTLSVDMEEREAEMRARVERMRRVCREHDGELSNKKRLYSNRT